MKLKGDCIYFKSVPEMYRREVSGQKNNTVRIISENEHNLMRWKLIREIEITDPVNDVSFRRVVTDITEIGDLLGSRIVVISWNGKEGEHDKANDI